MGISRVIASFLQVFVVFSFFCMGLFFFSIPFLPELRLHLSEFLLNQMELFTQVGIVFSSVAFLLLLGFYGLNRGRFLYIEMGTHTVSVEEALLRHSIQECFKLHFFQKIQLSNVDILWGKKLEIGISFSSTEENKQEEILMSLEKHLQLLLRQRFGYVKPFSLILKST